MVGYIYIFMFPNGKRYVGQTIRSVEQRMVQHFYDAKRRPLFLIDRAIRKYGEDNVKIECSFPVDGEQSYIDAVEDQAIMALNTLVPNGYNIRRGGSRGAHSEETKAKLSVAKMGHLGYWIGKHHSKETKAKIAAANRGKCLSQETKAKILAARKGYFHSEEVRAKMRRPRSEETKAKISAALKGHCHSEEAKTKMSLSRKKWWSQI
jgi:group I intron endonuclease